MVLLIWIPLVGLAVVLDFIILEGVHNILSCHIPVGKDIISGTPVCDLVFSFSLFCGEVEEKQNPGQRGS